MPSATLPPPTSPMPSATLSPPAPPSPSQISNLPSPIHSSALAEVRVGINRPNFLPWLGFMALLDTVDLFIVLDNIPISRLNYVTRNRIKDRSGEARWISQSKCREHTGHDTLVRDALLSPDPQWRRDLVNRITEAYRKAPYFPKYADALFEGLRNPENNLVRYNVTLLQILMRLFGFMTPFLSATDLLTRDYDDPEDRVIALNQAVGATAYYNARDGVEKGLYTPAKFAAHRLQLFKQNYTHPVYPQLHGAFVPCLSALDLLFNCGPDSLAILRSGSAWERP